MKYYILSNITRIFLEKLRKYHKDKEQMLVFSKDFIGEEIFSFGVYEKNDIHTIVSALDFDCSNHTLLDIGANIGNHTVQFSKHFKNIIAFEPNKMIFDILNINVRNRDNVTTHNFGLSNKNGTFLLNVPEGNFGGAQITETVTESSIEIELKRLDDFFTDAFSVVKIDVEGHEAKALLGMHNAILKNKPLICIELINTEESGSEIIQLLKKIGYENFYIPHIPSFFFNKNSDSHFWKLFNGLFLKQKLQLRKIETFDKSFYNMVICEHKDSQYLLKKECILD